MSKRYFGDFEDYENMHWLFSDQRYDSGNEVYVDEPIEGFPVDADVLFAYYGSNGPSGRYGGDAVVYYRKDGQVYETTAGHCSCFGLEGGWSPGGVITKAAIEMRPSPVPYAVKGDDEAERAFNAMVEALP